jgi:hypothetical protein
MSAGNCQHTSAVYEIPDVNALGNAALEEVIFVFWITGRRSLLKIEGKFTIF